MFTTRVVGWQLATICCLLILVIGCSKMDEPTPLAADRRFLWQVRFVTSGFSVWRAASSLRPNWLLRTCAQRQTCPALQTPWPDSWGAKKNNDEIQNWC